MPDPTIYRTEYLLHVGMYVGYVLGIHLFTISLNTTTTSTTSYRRLWQTATRSEPKLLCKFEGFTQSAKTQRRNCPRNKRIAFATGNALGILCPENKPVDTKNGMCLCSLNSKQLECFPHETYIKSEKIKSRSHST